MSSSVGIDFSGFRRPRRWAYEWYSISEPPLKLTISEPLPLFNNKCPLNFIIKPNTFAWAFLDIHRNYMQLGGVIGFSLGGLLSLTNHTFFFFWPSSITQFRSDVGRRAIWPPWHHPMANPRPPLPKTMIGHALGGSLRSRMMCTWEINGVMHNIFWVFWHVILRFITTTARQQRCSWGRSIGLI